ncbi:MAG: hypothetical protein ABUS49_05805 [Acidobacteriota bacterium]
MVACGLVYCALHGMWFLFALILVVSAAAGWFGRRLADWRPAPKK